MPRFPHSTLDMSCATWLVVHVIPSVLLGGIVMTTTWIWLAAAASYGLAGVLFYIGAKIR